MHGKSIIMEYFPSLKDIRDAVKKSWGLAAVLFLIWVISGATEHAFFGWMNNFISREISPIMHNIVVAIGNNVILSFLILAGSYCIFVVIIALLQPIMPRIRETNVSQSTQPTPELAKPPKIYSDREKSDLADALRDLSKIINKDGPNIKQKAQYVVDIWNLGSSRISSQDITNLIAELNEIGKLANNLYQDLHDDKGFLKKYIAYNDVLGPILHNYDFIPQLQGSINGFRNVLMTIQRAEKHNDRDLITLMMANSRLAFDSYLKGIRIFDELFRETNKRITDFRNSHL